MPGVSTNTICAPREVTMPRMIWRVVCGLSAVLEILAPTSLFSKVDLPTFERPISAQNPPRMDSGVFMRARHAALQHRQRPGCRPLLGLAFGAALACRFDIAVA